jgi:hypothetical protein
MDEVALGENAAPGSYARRVAFAFQRSAGEIIQADADTVRLLLQEPACPRSAERVGNNLPGFLQTILKRYDERTLPADLNNGFYIGIEME